MVTPARFERATFPLGGGRSIQLSYGAIGSWQGYRVWLNGPSARAHATLPLPLSSPAPIPFANQMPDVWRLLSSLGDSRWLLPMIVILLLGLPGSTFKWRALASIALTAVLTLASKLAYMGWGRGIASIDFTGFSGHAAMSSAIYPLAGALLAGTSTGTRVAGFAAGAILALLIGWSRLPLHAHSVSEVVAGLLLGLGATLWTLRYRPLPARPSAWILAVALAAGLALPLTSPHLRTHQLVEEIAKWLSGRTEVIERHRS